MGGYDYVVHENVVARANQDGTVIVMKMDEGNTFFKINGVAAEVWKDLSAQKKVEQIINEILNKYNASEEQVKNDIEKLLGALLDKDLIKRA